MENGSKGALIDRIEYFMEYPEDEYKLCLVFSAEERNILRTIQKFEQIRYFAEQGDMRNIRNENSDSITEIVFRKRDCERDISFRLKEQVMDQIERLMGMGKVEAWLDILTWYQLLKGKNLIIDKSWEFPILETMLKAFQEEWKQQYSNGKPISILSLHTMKELTDSYFIIVFMLRRLEYGVEPMDELFDYLAERKLSISVVRVILGEARIFDKKKVGKIIDDWARNQDE